MNSALRKAINQRNMWRSKYFRNRNDKQLRMKYVMWRNRVVKLHKNSISNYFTHRCHGNVGSKNFYKTIKPFLSTKQSHYSGSKIILKEDDSIISGASKVADIFNMYYASIAEYKHQSDGLNNLDFDNAIDKHASHASISLMKQSISGNYESSFSPISAQSMSKQIGKYLNTDCRIAIYKSFISSNFSYCPVSWMFCGKRNSDKLEKLQERALRFVF